MSKMISLTDDGAFMASDNITAQDFLNIVLSAQFNLFNNLVQMGQPKEELYDLANQAASAFLEAFIPDKELRPDLTAEAILEAENKLLAEKVAQLEEEEEIVVAFRPDGAIDTGVVGAIVRDENLIPLNSLDEYGKPVKPVHKTQAHDKVVKLDEVKRKAKERGFKA